MTKARDLGSLLGASSQIDNTKITLDANEIPALDTSKITTGTLSADRIDNNSLSNVTALPFSAGTDWQSTIVTGSTLTAVAGKGYWIDTTSNACTITLPASASVGDFIEFSDYARTWGTNAITINQNSLNYQGATSPNPIYDTSGQSFKIIYSGSTKGWIPSTDDDVTYETPPSYTVDFLVIAGGGAGSGNQYATGGGGGGAGGYRNSYSTESSGGGGSSETSLTFSAGTVYTITVGAGGTGAYRGSTSGSNSSISGSDITTVTSTGGGAGAGGNSWPALSGGSGGGGSNDNTTGGAGTANQGYDGGDCGETRTGAGGGGANAVGADSTSTNGGNGGNGLASSITGSSVTRAGGGGGGSIDYSTTTTAGTGGSGGGGNGGKSDSGGSSVVASTAGTANTGSGGGGATGNGTALGSNGGSGVVILRMATADYTGTTSGSPTVTTDGTDTILVFNASGSYTG